VGFCALEGAAEKSAVARQKAPRRPGNGRITNRILL
jgi:hypothetical protein